MPLQRFRDSITLIFSSVIIIIIIIIIPLSHTCGVQAAVLQMEGREARDCLAEGRAEGLSFDCGQYGSFAVYVRFPAALCGYRTGELEQRKCETGASGDGVAMQWSFAETCLE